MTVKRLYLFKNGIDIYIEIDKKLIKFVNNKSDNISLIIDTIEKHQDEVINLVDKINNKWNWKWELHDVDGYIGEYDKNNMVVTNNNNFSNLINDLLKESERMINNVN